MEMNYVAKIGRPKSLNNKELVTLDEAIVRAQAELNLPKPPFSRRTLQNKVCRGEFSRFGTYHIPMVDWNEVRRSLHWKRRVG